MNFSGYTMSGDEAVARVNDNSAEPIIKEKQRTSPRADIILNQIDRDDVVDFVMDRYERIEQLIQTLDLRQSSDK